MQNPAVKTAYQIWSH